MGTPPTPPPLAGLRSRLTDLTIRDEHRLRRRIDGTARKVRDAAALAAVTAQIAADIDTAEERVRRRRAAVPAIVYPEELPVSQRREDLLAAIRDNQVVIVAGETGSGKTTQLPKLCLELGRGVRGAIGHTQPRRLAARTVAERIAEELRTELGGVVGYQVRFTGQVGEDTMVKLMTDGILLAEIANDRLLTRYDTLIIDEAHERSLNIDFILGYVKQLLPRRPDLKVIVTSATIDPQRFARHFAIDGRDAPIVEVSGRTYPVEVRYRPLGGAEVDEDRDQIQGICDAVGELSTEGAGGILVFLSGEREIRDTADALKRMELRDTDILPLYARLSIAEQHRVFQPKGARRIVLATNVAETSLTVPGIRYVIDPGTARISRYSQRTKVQRLPIEPVSQASANQRKGRCGRVAEGVCIRLYSESDFLARPAYTDPEILRTNLASVILQMTALGLGDLAGFPFIDGPDRRNITDGVNLLRELGALEPERAGQPARLTPVGRTLAALPVDPRLARMMVAADRNGCLREVLVIVSALAIQDPRERPTEHQQAATQSHARFADKDSDFLAYLNLWKYLKEQQKALSSNQFRRMCRTEFLNYLRVREWQDLHAQLRQLGAQLGLSLNQTPADATRIHQSLLAGLLSHVGLRDTPAKSTPRRDGKTGDTPRREPAARNEYLGARGARFAVFPGSALARKPPQWVMAGELVETSRLWARMVAAIEPEWAEELAGHLVKRSYSEPHWEKKQGAVLASEKVTLYGVPLVAARKVNFGRIDPVLSRELFIRHALVEGEWNTHHPFFHANNALREEVEELEHRARRRDILVDDETLFDFYDKRIPAEVVSARHFDAWWKRARHADPDLLTLTKSILINEGTGGVSAADYPDAWRVDGLELPLTYQFEPGTAADGVTVHVPLPALGRLGGEGFDWQVPGLREELVTALIRALPKPLRRYFVPVPDHARAMLAALAGTPHTEPLADALAYQLGRLAGTPVPRDAFQWDKVPEHLRMTFRVEDENGAVLGEGRDLDALRDKLMPRTREVIAAAAQDVTRTGLHAWTIGTLPRVVEQARPGYAVQAYPALVDEGDSVAVRAFGTPREAEAAMRAGTRRLLLLVAPPPVKALSGRLSNESKLALSRNPHGSVLALMDDCAGAAVDRLVHDAGGPAWDEEGFGALTARVRAGLGAAFAAVVHEVERILTAAHQVSRGLTGTANPALLPALTDLREQLAHLVYPGFVTATGYDRLPDVPRYLAAMQRRLERLPSTTARDRDLTIKLQEIEREYRDLRAAYTDAANAAALDEVRWMIEELRVNWFAQAIGTPYPISDKRVFKALDAIPVPGTD